VRRDPGPARLGAPDGARITLAFAVHRAADAAQRIGTLVFVNGTGVSSEQFVADRMGRGGFPVELINRFDIVGVDPRGGAHPNNTPLPLPVRSTALHCDQPPHQPDSRYFPGSAEQYPQDVRATALDQARFTRCPFPMHI
jgi:hypothetical protein